MRKPTFITPPNKLKDKVGFGGIPADLLQRGQAYLESNPVDFTPYAIDFLADLKKLAATVKPGKQAAGEVDNFVKIIMQLKANGSMFHYQLLSMTSDVMLRFMENITQIDADFIEILKVYIRILTIIIDKKLTGNGGHEGYILTSELQQACQRYNKKYNIS